MAKLILATLCDDVRQEKSGKFSLMGMFDQFLVVDFRAPLPSFRLFAQIGFESDGNHSLVIEFRRVEGEMMFKAESTHHVTGINNVTGLYQATINLRFDNLTVPGPGTYEFALHGDGQHIASLPVGVLQAPPRLVQ
jgi:hypothetical protein